MTSVKATALSISGSFGPPVDQKGNPVKVEEGSLAISSSDGSIARVGPDPDNPDDPYGFKVILTGMPGIVQISIIADSATTGKIGDLTGVETIEVLPAIHTGFKSPVMNPAYEEEVLQ